MRYGQRAEGPVCHEGWIYEHPWMTFFLASGAISGLVTLDRGRPKTLT